MRINNCILLTIESRIDVKPGISCSPRKTLHMGCTIFLNASFSSPADSPVFFILLYNLKESTVASDEN